MSKFVMLCGLPASGKSTYCEQYKHNKDWVVLSSDEIRIEFGDVNDQSKNEEVFKILHQRVKDNLKTGKNVIYDATNLNRKRRIHFLQNELRGISCEKICVLFATPYEMCCARNFARDRQVPVEALIRMYKNFEVPCYAEQWDDIQIVWANYQGMVGFEYNICTDINKWCEISHNNPHHFLSIGDHMIDAASYIMKKYPNEVMLYPATLLHDCGKPDTKAFIDSKGNSTNGIAHYYEHQNVSSYKALFYLREIYSDAKWDMNSIILYISLLVNLHMKPFLSWKQSEKAKEKDIKLFGEDIYNDVMKIHEADLAAH